MIQKKSDGGILEQDDFGYAKVLQINEMRIPIGLLDHQNITSLPRSNYLYCKVISQRAVMDYGPQRSLRSVGKMDTHFKRIRFYVSVPSGSENQVPDALTAA